MRFAIYITLKDGVLDTQGKATKNALKHLGFDSIQNVRKGTYLELDLDESNEQNAENKVKEMCNKLLANTVIENYRVEFISS